MHLVRPTRGQQTTSASADARLLATAQATIPEVAALHSPITSLHEHPLNSHYDD